MGEPATVKSQWWRVRMRYAVPLFVLTGTVWAYATFTPKFSRETLERSNPQAVRDEVTTRRAPIIEEISRLAPGHPWAGQYRAGELGERTVLLLAPGEGCVAISIGCMGLNGWNYGSVTERDGRLHIAFALPNTPGEFGDFDCDYEVVGCDENRFLRPPERRDVLRPIALE